MQEEQEVIAQGVWGRAAAAPAVVTQGLKQSHLQPWVRATNHVGGSGAGPAPQASAGLWGGLARVAQVELVQVTQDHRWWSSGHSDAAVLWVRTWFPKSPAFRAPGPPVAVGGAGLLCFQAHCWGSRVLQLRSCHHCVCLFTKMKDPDLGVNSKGEGGDQSNTWKRDQRGWGTCWVSRAHVWGLRGGRLSWPEPGREPDSALMICICVFPDLTPVTYEDSKRAVTS